MHLNYNFDGKNWLNWIELKWKCTKIIEIILNYKEIIIEKHTHTYTHRHSMRKLNVNKWVYCENFEPHQTQRKRQIEHVWLLYKKQLT